MEVVTLSTLRVASVAWQPRAGLHALTVVAKATYDLVPGESPLAVEQEYPCEEDNYWNDDPARSLHAPTDLVPFKKRAEVLLVGHAFAPRAEPVGSLVARLIVADVDKSIRVFADRSWTSDDFLTEGARFVRMGLRWERSAGGPGTANPVGVPPPAPGLVGPRPIPNLLPTGLLLVDPSEPVPTIGFGPIAASWSSRRERLGRHEGAWSDGDWSKRPLPDDFDPAYFSSAPEDQQTEALRPDERIVLENLHPEHPRLVTNLAGVHPRAFVDRPGRPPLDLVMVCDTMWIDTDRAICTLTWRGQVTRSSPDEEGRVLIAMERPGQRIAWTDVERLERSLARGPAPGAAAKRQAAKTTAMDASMFAAAVLPFAQGGPSDFVLPAPPASGPLLGDYKTSGTVDVSPEEARKAMPFLQGPADPTDTGEVPGFRADASPPWLAPTPGAQPRTSEAPPPGASTPPPPFVAPVAAPPASVSPPPFAAPASVPPAPPPFAAPASVPPAPPPFAAPAPPPIVAQTRAAGPPPIVTTSPWAAASRTGDPTGAQAPASTAPSRPPPADAGARPFQMPVVERDEARRSAFERPGPSVGPEAHVSAAAASNAVLQQVVAPPPADASAAPAPRSVAAAPPPEVLELLWFDPEAMGDVRDTWKELLASLEPDKPEITIDPGPDAPPAAARDERDITSVLSHAQPAEIDRIGDRAAQAVDARGVFTAPLCALFGELVLPFDEVETLQATMASVSPLAQNDKRLKDVLDAAGEALKTPVLGTSPGIADRLTARIHETFGQGNRILTPAALEAQVERVLLEQRKFQLRTAFGAPKLRGLLGSLPVYLPEELVKKLPLFRAFRSRIVGRVHFTQDQYEGHPYCIHAVALARAIPGSTLRAGGRR